MNKFYLHDLHCLSFTCIEISQNVVLQITFYFFEKRLRKSLSCTRTKFHVPVITKVQFKPFHLRIKDRHEKQGLNKIFCNLTFPQQDIYTK